ncbi:hypothetical protein KY290_026621 [Solanum tuberosum]|uniref:Aminotransferase-like plant mobile domain-containing protein n=1 Tax=Solanum tuberosum TaxID=4113 RepID=A0ABQ7UZ03_SOLTU|nr:hypothetical protein KY284_023629 [Solanum tuberosum]KAH0756351.1 hypothetical protein KY290_026621 [Solanum tuberosum]
MAHGKKFSLALPFLASIYRGLKDMSTSSNLGACDILLPIHYVYGWIDEYFETYYCGTRPNKDDDLIVEAYSPHRFSQQFGYYQDVPTALIEHRYDDSLLALVFCF